MTTSEKKSQKAKLRWAKARFKKGKATQKDIELIKSFEPGFVDEPRNVEPVVIQEQPKTTGVENSENYFNSDVNSFIEDANKTFEKVEPENIVFEPIDPENLEGENESFESSESTENQSAESLPIDGALLLFMVDLLAPQLFAFIGRKYLKKKIEADDLKSYDDLKPLQKSADLVAQKIAMNNLPPEQILLIGIFFIYGSKLLTFENSEK